MYLRKETLVTMWYKSAGYLHIHAITVKIEPIEIFITMIIYKLTKKIQYTIDSGTNRERFKRFSIDIIKDGVK